MIRRRHVFYVEGYDPQGAEGYYDIFQRSWKRFLKIWPLKTKLGALEIDSEFFAHWEIDTAAPNWQVHTRYDFLRQEQFIRANMAEPMLRQVRRALWWFFDYLFSGTMWRVFLRLVAVLGGAGVFPDDDGVWLLLSLGRRRCWPGLCLRIFLAPLALAECRDWRRRRGRLFQAVAAARRPLVRGSDQQSLAVSLRIRARRAVVL